MEAAMDQDHERPQEITVTTPPHDEARSAREEQFERIRQRMERVLEEAREELGEFAGEAREELKEFEGKVREGFQTFREKVADFLEDVPAGKRGGDDPPATGE
jgi:hypothetical protein